MGRFPSPFPLDFPVLWVYFVNGGDNYVIFANICRCRYSAVAYNSFNLV